MGVNATRLLAMQLPINTADGSVLVLIRVYLEDLFWGTCSLACLLLTCMHPLNSRMCLTMPMILSSL